jgi:hypothetical protein
LFNLWKAAQKYTLAAFYIMGSLQNVSQFGFWKKFDFFVRIDFETGFHGGF